MMTNKLRIFLAITSTSSSLLILNCLPAIALAPSSGFDANGIDRDVNTDMWEDENEDNPGTVGSPSRPSEDDTGSPRATEPTTTNSVLDFAFGYHCEHPVSYDSGHMMFPTYWRCDDPPPSAETPSDPPSTQKILRHAAATIHADGAGIYKQPPHVSYTNKYIPTLVSVTNPTQTHVINLLGHDITITLKATNYEWDWGDGTPHTITAYHGMAFEKGMDPNKDPRLIRHYYTPPNGWRSRFDGPYPDATRTITLTTTWSGTATNPFTGETQTINGLVTTKETTGPFPLNHLTVSNTDTWEEKQGH